MKAKIISLFLILAARIGTLSAYDAKIGNFYYNLDATNLTATMTYERYSNVGANNYTSTLNITNANIPSSVTYGGKTYSVTSIGGYAFANCSGLKSITIPSSVTSIEGYAFYNCGSLTSISIGSNVTSIGGYAFWKCGALTSIVIPNKVESIGEWALKECSNLVSLTIGHNLKNIGDYAFYGLKLNKVIWNSKNCPDFKDSRQILSSTSITSFIIGDDVEHIPSLLCFDSKITSICIPVNVTSVGDFAFSNCTSLSNIVWNAKNCGGFNSTSIPFNCSTSYETYGTTRYNSDLRSQITSITFGNEVNSIPSYLCSGMTNITSVNIPNSVTGIGSYAFSGCTGLTSITIPNNVTSIGNQAFYNCKNLISVVLGNSVKNIGESAFQSCSGLTLITISNSVTSIGKSSFSSCSNLASVTLGNSVTNVGECAFQNCSALQSINIPATVKSISKSTFDHCSSLSTITISEGVTYIGESAFSYCSSLSSITIPSSMAKIGDCVFKGCSNLKSVIWNAKDCESFSLQRTPFYFYNSSSTSNNFDIRNQITSFVFGNEVETIPTCLCYGLKNLSSVAIPESVTEIGTSAFSGCSGLTSIAIGDHVTSINIQAFYNCSNLKTITIGKEVTSIAYNAFKGCTMLTNVIWNAKNVSDFTNKMTPFYYYNSDGSSYNYDLRSKITSFVFGDEVEYIPAYLCSYMSNLTSVSIPNSVTSIGSSAFSGCASLTNATIGNSVTSIGSSAFSSCTGLTSVTIPNSVIEIGSSVFSNCTSLTGATIGNGVTSIGSSAFSSCTGLTSVTIPNNVIEIGSSVFSNCTSLTGATIGNGVTSIGSWAFYNCSDLKSVIVQSETPSTLGSSAFNKCTKLLGIYVPCGTLDIYKQSWADYASKIMYQPTGYSVECKMNHNEAGSISVDNNICASSISVTSNYGYHFVQWSDGNTDNPRTIELTKDTTFTAEFAKNSYSITTASSNEEWGATAGDATVLYQEQVEISATANYGYHFTQWNDGYSSNPRTITVTKDATYTATFARNTYKITKITDNTQGSISGSSQAYYLDQVTLTAVPKYGYHFTQWSDGVTDNPRTFELTRDTTFTAVFAVDKSGTCGDNNLLTWEFDAESKTLTISGEGQLNSNYTFGVEAPSQTERLIIAEGVTSIGNNAFKDKCSTVTALALPSTVTTIGDYAFAGLSNRKFNTLVLPNTIISIGAHAFDGASYLQTIHFGSTLEEIGDYAFNGCTRVKQMTCLAEITPNVGTDGLTSISDLAKLYVPVDYMTEYQIDNNWKRFVLKPYGATETTVTDNSVIVVADDNTATFTWPTSNTADSYTIDITKDGVLFCQLIFNANGQLTGIAFAPGRNGQSMAPAATLTAGGMQFTVTGLNSSTSYAFSLTAKSGSTVVASYSGSFSTTGVATSTDVLQSNHAPRKFIRDNQVLILRDGKTYTIQGVEVK